MSYVGIGNRQDYIADFPTQSFDGDGSTTTFTLNFEAVTGSVRVAVDNVLQPADGTAYYTNGNSITFTSAPATGTANITVTYLGTVRNVSSVSDGAITTAKLADLSVTNDKLAGSISNSKLSTPPVFETKLFHIREESSSGTQGGTATSGSWQTRTLDTIKTNEVGGSLSSNQFTLPSGTYFIYASAPAHDVIANRIKLYNISDSSDVMFGTNSYSDGSNNGMRSFLSGRFTITASKTFEIQHRVNRTNATFGYGIANGYAAEVYTDALIWKVA